MPHALRHLLAPLNLGAFATLSAVGLSLRWVVEPAHAAIAWALLFAFTAAFVAHDLLASRHARIAHAMLLLQPLLGLGLLALTPKLGTAQVLLVIWTAVIAMEWRLAHAVAAVALANVAMWWIVHTAGHPAPLMVTLLFAGFEVFAAMTAHYARTAEQARDALVRVNADLLATRALLADSARDAERLRVARELHDVAGHKLTALTLNLRALGADAALSGRGEVRIAQQLAAELLADLRGIVQAMRDSRGLDLATALRALAAPLPRPVLALSIDEDVRIDDALTAETVLRLVQEALTNAARHADADVLVVSIREHDARLRIDIHDDGRMHGALREGNGLCGMRERVTEAGGTLDLRRSREGALAITASLPL